MAHVLGFDLATNPGTVATLSLVFAASQPPLPGFGPSAFQMELLSRLAISLVHIQWLVQFACTHVDARSHSEFLGLTTWSRNNTEEWCVLLP